MSGKPGPYSGGAPPSSSPQAPSAGEAGGPQPADGTRGAQGGGEAPPPSYGYATHAALPNAAAPPPMYASQAPPPPGYHAAAAPPAYAQHGAYPPVQSQQPQQPQGQFAQSFEPQQQPYAPQFYPPPPTQQGQPMYNPYAGGAGPAPQPQFRPQQQPQRPQQPLNRDGLPEHGIERKEHKGWKASLARVFVVGGTKHTKLTSKEPPPEPEAGAACDFVSSGPVFHPMRVYSCKTCKMGKGVGVCEVCAFKCHFSKGHKLENHVADEAYCDCGSQPGKWDCQGLPRG